MKEGEPDDQARSSTVPDLPGAGSGQLHSGYVPTFCYITVEAGSLGSYQHPVLLDTGSSISLIDATIAANTLACPFKEGNVHLQGIGSEDSRGYVTMTFTIKGWDKEGKHDLRFRHDFYIVDNLKPGILLGIEWIQGHHVLLDSFRATATKPLPEGKEVSWGIYCLRGWPKEESSAVNLVCGRATQIPPRHHSWVPVRWEPEPPAGSVYVTDAVTWADDSGTPGSPHFSLQASILSSDNDHLLISNLSDETVYITSNAMLNVARPLTSEVSPTGMRFEAVAQARCHTVETWGPEDEEDAQEVVSEDELDIEQEVDCRPLDPREDQDYFARGAQPDDSDSTLVDGIFQIGNQPGTSEPPAEIVNLLRNRVEAFSLDGRPGLLKGPKLSIPVQDENLLRAEPARQASPKKREIIRRTVDQLLELGIIEPSASRISSPVVIVHQNGKLRFCVDYRGLNAVTRDDSYPLPRADDIFDAFAGASIFSSLDMVKAYHQAEVEESDRWKTAFACDKGLFQYRRVPFGLKGAPAFFQRCMDSLLSSMRWSELLVYLDDIIVYSRTMEEHVASLRKLLDIVIQANVKLDPKKCHFAFKGLKVLGRFISADGVSIIENRAQAIVNLKPPENLADLWRALGLWNYYRAHIPHFSRKTAPLQALTEGIRWEGKGKMIDKDGSKIAAKQKKVEWNKERLECFANMNNEIANLTTLAYPMENRKYFLYVDASQEHFAAALHQQHLRPVVDSQIQPHSFAVAIDLKGLDFATIAKAQKDDPTWSSLVRSAEKGQVPKGYAWQQGILIKASDDKVCLPKQLFQIVFEQAHAGHQGQWRTQKKVEQEWHHPKMAEAVESFVKHCATCIRTKPLRPSGSLSEDEDHTGLPFDTISVDIMLGLPKTSTGLDACLVIVDTFTKTILFRPLRSTAKASDVYKGIEDAVLRQGWQPARLISDHDSKFVGALGQAFAKRLGAQLTPSAPYHQQANPVERYIQTATQALRALCLDKDDSRWDEVIPALELSLNSTPSTVTGYSAYDLLYVHRPRLLRRLASHLGVGSIEEEGLFSRARIEQARKASRKARDAVKDRYDTRKAPLPELKEGDAVMIRLKDRPLPADRIQSKLQAPKEGPFRVKEVLSPHRVRLDLPDDMGGKDIWDVSQLEPLPPDDEFGRPGLRAEGSGVTWWEPERILDERLYRGRKRQFRVKWKNSSRLTWTDEKTLLEDQCFDLINDWRERRAEDGAEGPNAEGFMTPPPRNLDDDNPSLEQLLGPDAAQDFAVYIQQRVFHATQSSTDHQTFHVTELHTRPRTSAPSGTSTFKTTSEALTTDRPNGSIPQFETESDALDRHPVHRPQQVMIAGKLHLLYERPVAFTSKKTSKSEKKLLGAELEMRCLRWAFFFFRIYLEGSRVGVVTDHLPIQGMLLAKAHRQFTPLIERVRVDLQPYLHRWSFHHKKGSTHTNVDALSRLQQVDDEPSTPLGSSNSNEPSAASDVNSAQATDGSPTDGADHHVPATGRPSVTKRSSSSSLRSQYQPGPANISSATLSASTASSHSVSSRAGRDLTASLTALLNNSPTKSPLSSSPSPPPSSPRGKRV